MFNKSEIMKAAWVLVRRANVARFGLRAVLRNALRTVWAKVKAEASEAARRPMTDAQARIWTIESKDIRLTSGDYAEILCLRAAA